MFLQLLLSFMNFYPINHWEELKHKSVTVGSNLSLLSCRKSLHGSMHPSFLHDITQILRKYDCLLPTGWLGHRNCNIKMRKLFNWELQPMINMKFCFREKSRKPWVRFMATLTQDLFHKAHVFRFQKSLNHLSCENSEEYLVFLEPLYNLVL